MQIKRVAGIFLAMLFLCSGLPTGAWAVDTVNAGKWLVYANAVYAQKDYDKAIGAYSNSLKLDNTNAGAYQGLGNCFYAKGDKVNALKYYKYALQLNPSNTALANFVSSLAASSATPAASPASAMIQANTLYSQKQYDQALAAYNQVLQADPNSAKAYQGMGNCYYAKGDKTDAVTAYRRALDLDPSNTQLRSFLASYAPESQSGVAGNQTGGDWTQPAWRSAVLPGWGQFYNDQPTKGWIFGTVTIGLLAGTVITYMIGDQARVAYEAVNSTNQADYDGPYNTWSTMASINHVCYIGFGVAYVYNIIDAIVSARSIHTASIDSPVQVSLLPGGGEVKYKLLEF